MRASLRSKQAKRRSPKLLLAILAAVATATSLVTPAAPGAAQTTEGSADIGVIQTDTPDPVTATNNVAYEITVFNSGPDTATGVTLRDSQPAGATFVSADPEEACFLDEGGGVTCNLGNIPPESSAQVTIVWKTPAGPGTTSNEVSVSSNEDPNSENNTDTETTTRRADSLRDQESGYVDDGGTVSTGSTTSPRNPTSTTVTIPPGVSGTVRIREVAGTPADCGGTGCFGQTSVIDSPSSTASNPLRFKFRYDKSSLPRRFSLRTATMWHDGVLVPRCEIGSYPAAVPDPCLGTKKHLGGGDVRFIVRASDNGRWRPS